MTIPNLFWLLEEAFVPADRRDVHPFTGAVNCENSDSPLKTGEGVIKLRIYSRVASPCVVVSEHHNFFTGFQRL